MVAFVTRMGAGFPGRVSRADSLTIEAAPINNAAPPTAYGQPVKLSGGLVTALAASDAASVIWGWLVAPFPTQQDSVAPAVNSAPPVKPFGISDVLRRGYIIVPVAAGGGSPAKGGTVYVVTTAGTGGNFPLSSIVTSASPGSSAAAVAAVNAQFTGTVDANGNVEIEYAIAP
jgi:hypothetical protein